MKRLEDKVCIVTGAAHGIGRAIAERFGNEGALVLVTDIDHSMGQSVADEVCRHGGRARSVQVDVSSADEIEKTKRSALDAWGRIDVLVNNAAYLSAWHNVAEASDDEWDRSYAVTLKGAAAFTAAVLPAMIEQRGGSIINISSIQGLVAGRSSAAYTSMKHALIGLTRSTACDFGAHHIRANVICPGAIHTRISPPEGSELHQRQLSKTMLGRIGEANEVASAAVFLASEESSYITGAVLPVDGGWSAL